MSVKRVTMRHPGTKAEIQAPATAVKIYERSGWTLVDNKAAQDSPETPAPAGKARSAKEETK